LRRLFLEEVVEGLAGVHGPRGRNLRLNLRGLRVRSRRGVLFDGRSEFVEGAIVLGVLGRDALGDRLGALKLGAAIEKTALFAAMKFEAALGTLSVGIETRSEDGAAIGTAGSCHGANHARGSGPQMIVHPAGTALRRLAIVWPLLLFSFFGIAITAMAILTIHGDLRK